MRRAQPAIAGSEHDGDPEPRNAQPPEAGKGRKTDSPQSLQRGTQPADRDSSPVRPISDF